MSTPISDKTPSATLWLIPGISSIKSTFVEKGTMRLLTSWLTRSMASSKKSRWVRISATMNRW